MSVRMRWLCGVAMAGATALAQSSGTVQEAQRHLSHGLQLAQQKQYKQAQLEFERANVLQPGDFAILFNLGQAEWKNGEAAQAEAALTQALKLKPASREALLVLAEVEAGESRPLDALDLLARARAAAPNDPEVLYRMAEIGIAQRYYEDAVPLLEQAAQLAPERADIATALGESYFKSDKVDKTIAVFGKLTQTHPSVVAYAYLGFAYTYLGRFDEARQAFRSGLKLDPKNDACLFHLGYLAKLQGKTAEAETTFAQVLQWNPENANALIELANLRMEQKRYAEAAELLRRYVRVSATPASGYYKLAMAEKGLGDKAASQKDLAQFQALQKDAPATAHPYDHLYEYVDSRAKLAPQARLSDDLASLKAEAERHPDQPEVLYALAEAYLKAGDTAGAQSTVDAFDARRPDDARTLTGLGVLLANYGLYPQAAMQFEAALKASPEADDARFDLANVYLHQGRYNDALSAAQAVSEKARGDEAYASLLADIEVHLGDGAQAETLYGKAIERNPDKDQNYLSLALLLMREGKMDAARETLLRGQTRVPGSGKILWGLGLTAVMDGDTNVARADLEKAVELLPEWPGSYATLGVLYYQTGQMEKAREVLDRFKGSGARGGLDVGRIEQTLASAPAAPAPAGGVLPEAQRRQILGIALYLADKTL